MWKCKCNGSYVINVEGLCQLIICNENDYRLFPLKCKHSYWPFNVRTLQPFLSCYFCEMKLVSVICEGNDSKRFDGRVWWEDISTITEVNGKEVDKTLDKSQLQNGDKVVVKFGDKSKKLFKGVID